MQDKKYFKVRDHRQYTAEYGVPKTIPIAFHNGFNYDYHFIMKELTEEFKNQLSFLGEKAVKHITFTVPIEKEVTRIDKNGKLITKSCQ